MSDILSVSDVDAMIELGDIDFEKYKSLCVKHGLTATDEQIKTAIGQQTDDDDDEFVLLVSKIIA